MKSIIGLTILAFAVAAVMACDPDSDNQPSCNSRNVNVPTRNTWDPVHYWECKSATGQAELVPCPAQTGFDGNQNACVPWSQWQWVEPCPEAAATN